MRIVTMSLSGNVGKTTISSQLLAPRLNYQVLSIESQNASDNSPVMNQLHGTDTLSVMRQVIDSKNIIIDIGASQIESLISSSEEFGGLFDFIDYFIIPTTESEKQLIDSQATVKILKDLGIPKSKIKVILNRASKKTVIATVDRLKSLGVDVTSTIYESMAFDLRRNTQSSLSQLAVDPRNYEEEYDQATTSNEKDIAFQSLATKKAAVRITTLLDQVFLDLQLN